MRRESDGEPDTLGRGRVDKEEEDGERSQGDEEELSTTVRRETFDKCGEIKIGGKVGKMKTREATEADIKRALAK